MKSLLKLETDKKNKKVKKMTENKRNFIHHTCLDGRKMVEKNTI